MRPDKVIDTLRRAAAGPALAGHWVRSVRLVGLYRWTDPLTLTITWSMPDPTATVTSDALSLPGVTASVVSRPADTVVQIDRKLALPDEVESAVLIAAWRLGAWDMRRIEHAPLADPADWRQPRHGITVAFGRSAYVIAGQPMAIGDAADDDVCAQAAADGYVCWSFVPLALAGGLMVKRWGGADHTLRADRTRDGEPPIGRGRWYRPSDPQTARDHVYQLGRGNHGNRSKSSRERRA